MKKPETFLWSNNANCWVYNNKAYSKNNLLQLYNQYTIDLLRYIDYLENKLEEKNQ